MHDKLRGGNSAPESLYNLDGEYSVKTILDRHDSRYADSSGAPIINLQEQLLHRD